MSNQNKNKLGFKELMVPIALAAAIGGVAAKNILRVSHLENGPDTELVKTTETDLGPTGHYGGTSTKLVPKTVLSAHSDRYP